MKSHRYAFHLVELVRYLRNLVLPIIGCAIILHGAARCHFLPSPYPAVDVDRTILTHQTIASKQPLGAQWLLIGDSSCLMDVSAGSLLPANEENAKAYNFGTFMQLGLNGYSALLSHYLAVNTNMPLKVILLLHPEMLRGTQPLGQYLVFMSDLYAGEDPGELSASVGHLREWLGLDIIENRLLSRFPLSLPKAYGRYYGFNLDLDRFLSQHAGSAVDPNHFEPSAGQGNAEYRLARQLESACLAFRASMPTSVQLAVGITPIPDSFAPPNYQRVHEMMLTELSQWLRADAALTNLPATFPDHWFASTTHLNEAGALRYTKMLARQLAPNIEN